jgi:beta-glucosidase
MSKVCAEGEATYLDDARPVEERVNDLVSRMTLEEKVSQMIHPASAIERLGVPEYNWWNECLHGVSRAGHATVFPQAIGLAATWDAKLMHAVATAISDEARAKHHEAVRRGVRDIYFGLTFWSPNVNIFRDPRWGRGHETYGEDPYLTSRMGVAFVKGLQGDHPRYLKLVATPKHYAVHSGPENLRHSFDARVHERTLRDTYLPAFEACVREGGAASVMGAYNRVNGEAACASKHLLQEILRSEWGFEGYVVSDCGAIGDIYQGHEVCETPEEAAALAVRTGCDLNCGETYRFLVNAVKQGLLSEEDIDTAVKRLFTARFRLGMFDPPEMVPYARIPYAMNDCHKHRKLALKAARESLVLLKNDGLLPLSEDLGTIAVIGPYADDRTSLRGNYSGTPCEEVTILDGIKHKVGKKTTVLYVPGTDITGVSTEAFYEAATVARFADVAIVCLGSSPLLEGEEGSVCGLLAEGDRHSLSVPGKQEELLKMVFETGTPVVLVLTNGSALAINWADENVPAILEAWYPGQAGGSAVADALFGDYNPAGRLPVTFYKSIGQLPPFEDYSMEGRTYRYFHGETLYPFGYGLSYTKFRYSNLVVSPRRVRPGKPVEVSVEVENVGDRSGEEVVQLYISDLAASVPTPIRHLCGFERIRLSPGKKRRVRFSLAPMAMSVIDDTGRRLIEPGEFTITVGAGQPGSREVEAGVNLLSDTFSVMGDQAHLLSEPGKATAAKVGTP